MTEHTLVDPTEYELDCNLMKNLKDTGHAFFQTFGRFTPIQRKAMPIILHGNDALLVSGTASGKTEAACAPLIERHYSGKEPWTILYISPTRALVNDLYFRLLRPSQQLNLRIKRRTGDHRDDLKIIPHIIITTPESFDSLLCRNKRSDKFGHDLGHVVAVVLDEIHLLHGTPRGDQLKWLLQRLKKLREFAVKEKWSKHSSVQIVGLSATIPNIQSVCERYFSGPVEVIQSSGGRPIETVSPSSEDPGVKSALLTYLRGLDKNEKILVFSNKRKRVDELAKYFRNTAKPFGYEIYAHHGSLSKNERESAEFAAQNHSKIIIFATSTLEIGIDIGDIDLIVLDQPAPDISSLLQRIGRGNRRTNKTRVMACSESLAELILQNAMIDGARDGWLGNGHYGLSYTVIRQQIASYIFQAPQKRRNTSSLKTLTVGMKNTDSLFMDILTKMIEDSELEYFEKDTLQLGEYWWKRAENRGSIHSNIESGGGANVIDLDSGLPIAHNVIYLGGKGIGIGGKSLEVRKWENMTIEVRNAINNPSLKGNWRYASSSHFCNASQPESLRRYLGITESLWPMIRENEFLYVFHLGGSIRNAVLNLLVEQYANGLPGIKINEWYVRLPGSHHAKPIWLNDINEKLLKLILNDEKALRKTERLLNRPHSNASLPYYIRIEEAWDWLNLKYEKKAIQDSQWIFLNDDTAENALKQFISP